MKHDPDPIVAYREFVDGSMRPVYADGKRQYVINDDGDRVYGVFFVPRDEAKIEEKPADASDNF
jgi:hypothetical protein